MEQKNYYSERQLNLEELARDLEPMFKIYFGLMYGLQVKRTSIAPVIDLSDANLDCNISGQLALMWTWDVTECDDEATEQFKQIWTLLYLPELRVKFALSTPQLRHIGADEEIYQENRFMYVKVKNQELSVGLIEQTEPVLSKPDASKFILSQKFVKEAEHHSLVINADLAEKGNHLFWAVDLGDDIYELTDKARKLDISLNEVRYYSQPESLGKKDYAGKEAFWHFDGKELHASKGEYLSDKEACKIYLQHLGNVAPMKHPLPLVDANSVGIERFWLVAKSGDTNFLVSAHTGNIMVVDDENMTDLLGRAGSTSDLMDLIGSSEGISINTSSSDANAEGSITSEFIDRCEWGPNTQGAGYRVSIIF